MTRTVTVRSIRARAGGKPIMTLVAHDTPTTGVVNEAGVDIVLAGDNMGNTVFGYDSTLPVTVENMANRTVAMARAIDDAPVITDMLFLSAGVGETSGIERCGRMLKEADADVARLECDPRTAELIERLTRSGVLIMAHLGLTPQRVKEVGYGRQGTSRDDIQEIFGLARAHAEAGAFSLVFEHVLANPTKQVTEAIDIPTIGIGAGPDCDGQVFVVDDMVGMSNRTPPFMTQFGDVKSEMEEAVGTYRDVVKVDEFSADEHSYVEDDLDELY